MSLLNEVLIMLSLKITMLSKNYQKCHKFPIAICAQVQHTMQFPGEYRVEWMSPEETYMHLESTGSKIYRGLVESVGMKKSAGHCTSILQRFRFN